MNSILVVSMDEEKRILEQLSIIDDQRRALDDMLNGPLGEMERMRIKKQKLFLKDKRVSLNSTLHSDIIA